MRHDDRRYLAGPNRFGSTSMAAYRVALADSEDPEMVARLLTEAIDRVRIDQGLALEPLVVRPGLRYVSVGIPCANARRAERLLALVRAELGLAADQQVPRRPRIATMSDRSDAPLPAKVPVAVITGTNGKSTTTRLLAQMVRESGHTPGVPTSDGVWVGDRLVLEGDYTGPQGTARALADKEVDVGVLEVARGGLLLKGLSLPRIDVGIITNVSIDHLGLDGVETEAELAWVKGIVVRAVHRGGVAVLPAADPWLDLLRKGVVGRIVLFGRDPEHPELQRHQAEGGEIITVIEDQIRQIQGFERNWVERVENIPITLGGIAKHNLDNALAATAGALGLGLPMTGIQAGLRRFHPTPDQNPGRLNVFSVHERTVVVDFAHNPAGLNAMIDVADALAAKSGGAIWTVIGTAGDRRDEDIAALGEIATKRSTHVIIKRTERYVRGRTIEEMLSLYKRGIVAAGGDPEATPIVESEVAGVQRALQQSAPGDVILVMCQEQRRELWALLGPA